jgi:hypothetical protein
MAWDFDGTDDYIEAALGANYDVPKTLACWFNSDTTNANKTLVSLAAGSITEDLSQGLRIQITSTGVVQAVTSSGTGANGASSPGSYSANTWHHAAGKFESSSSRYAYLDGAIGAQNTATRSTGGALDNHLIGQGSGGNNPPQPFNGRIAEVAIWDVALNDDEIAALAKGFRPDMIRPSKLLFYLPLVREVQDVRSGLTYTNAATAVAIHPRRIG